VSGLQKCHTGSDCPQGMYCVKSVLAASYCRPPAKKMALCNSEEKDGIYENLPPCEAGYKCEGFIAHLFNLSMKNCVTRYEK
ncbi:hypothetical protein CEXT_210811, partial [Caerostris extrusa]